MGTLRRRLLRELLPLLVHLILKIHRFLFIISDLILELLDFLGVAINILLPTFTFELELALYLHTVVLHLLGPHLHVLLMGLPHVQLRLTLFSLLL